MNLLNRFNISTRLVLLTVVGTLLLVANGLYSLRGLSATDEALHDLYANGMAHTVRTAKVIGLLNETHTEMLLALQHDPDSVFAAMHAHDVSVHLDQAMRNLDEIGKVWGEIGASELIEAERRMVDSFTARVDGFRDVVSGRFAAALASGDYAGANTLIMNEARELLRAADDIADQMLMAQMGEAEGNYKEALAIYDTTVVWLVVIVLLAVAASSVLTLLTRNGIAGAVSALDVAASGLAGGRLNARVDYDGQDELRHVADSFNEVGASFHSTVERVADTVTRVGAAADRTSSVSADTLGGIDQQKSEIEQVATAMTEMNATVHDVARNAAETAEAARAAHGSANQGRAVVQQAIDTINRLAGEVQSTSTVIASLQRESEQIGGVLDVIRGIAEQTNLLALNAAIEAARAGEQGRGFAVVADEVRTLASRTQASTSEIQEMISRLQSGAENAVSAMESGSNQAGMGVEHAAAAGQALDEITQAVNHITDMSTQIASAVEEQSAVTEEINRNINNITSVAARTLEGAQQNAGSAAEMAELAGVLRSEIGRFTL